MGCVESRTSREEQEEDINSMDTDMDADIVAPGVTLPINPKPQPIDNAPPQSNETRDQTGNGEERFQGPYIACPDDTTLQSVDNVSPKSMGKSQDEIRAETKKAEQERAEREQRKAEGKQAAREKLERERAERENAERMSMESGRNELKKVASDQEHKSQATIAEKKNRRKALMLGGEKVEGTAANKPDISETSASGKGETTGLAAQRADDDEFVGGKENLKGTTVNKPAQSQAADGRDSTKDASDDKSIKDRMDSKAPAEEDKTDHPTDVPGSNDTAPQHTDSDMLTDSDLDIPPEALPLLNFALLTTAIPNWILKKQRRRRAHVSGGAPSTSSPLPGQNPADPAIDKSTLTVIDPPSDSADPLNARIDHAMTLNPAIDLWVRGEPDEVKEGLGWLPLRLCPYGCQAFQHAENFGRTIGAPLWVDREENEWAVTVRGALEGWGLEWEEVGDIYYHTHAPSADQECNTRAFATEIEIPKKEPEEEFIWLHLKPRDQAVLLLTRCVFYWKEKRIDFSGDRFTPVLTVLNVEKGTPCSVEWAVMRVLGRSGLEWSDVLDVKYHILVDDCDPKNPDKDPILRPFHGEIYRQS